MKSKTLPLFLSAALVMSFLSGCSLPSGGSAPSVSAASIAQESSASDGSVASSVTVLTPAADSGSQEAAEPAAEAAETEEPVILTPAASPEEVPQQPAAEESAAEENESDTGYAAAYAAYLADLQSHQGTIRAYDWQMADGESHYPMGSEPNALKPAALVDIWGDDVPELIYVYSPYDYDVADLRIIGWENGAVKELCAFPQWDACVASGTSFGMFRTADEKTLYAYSYIGDEVGFYTWYAFREQDGALAAEKIAEADIHYASHDTKPDTFMVNGSSVDQAAYNAFAEDLAGRADMTVLYSARPELDSWFARLFELPSSGMSYDDAVLALYGESGNTSSSDSDPAGALFSSLSGLSLYFSSGAGAWSSDLFMEDGGRFTLNYHDSDMGSGGDGYDATLYICEASGRFDQVQKIDDRTYTMHIAELNLTNEPGTQWITQEDGGRLLHIASDPYGLEGTDTVTVYLPGTPISNIPDEAMFKMFYDGDVLNGVVIFGTGDFFTSQLPGALPAGGQPSAETAPADAAPAEPAPAEPAAANTGSADGQILPDSSDRVLSDSDIAGLSSEQIQTAINEIYARHGYAFKTPEIRTYFEQYSWYSAQNTDMDSVSAQFNSNETANVKLLTSRL